MQVLYIGNNNVRKIANDVSICLGAFDSLHIGHTEIIKKALSERLGLVGVMTFDIPPKVAFGDNQKEIILTIGEKTRILQNMGVDFLIVLRFDETMMNLSADSFIKNILVNLGTKHVYCGEDFRFGKNASGSVDDLKKAFDTHVVPLLNDKKGKISTTRIKNDIKSGFIISANKLLGRRYEVCGEVIHGDGVGKKINFPTANLRLSEKYVLPKNGVYFTYVNIDGIRYPAMTNIGLHPTRTALQSPLIEIHVLNFNREFYGWFIYLEFVKRIRPEMKFKNMNALKKQLLIDRETIKNLVSKTK